MIVLSKVDIAVFATLFAICIACLIWIGYDILKEK